MTIYIAHSQKTSNALSTSRQYFAKKVSSAAAKCVETQCKNASCLWLGKKATVTGIQTVWLHTITQIRYYKLHFGKRSTRKMEHF